MMPEDLTFYTHPMSRGRIVRWMLEEVGQPYRTEALDFGDAMKSSAYRAINPMAKVPALVHGSRVVTETPAICAYLADAFPEASLAPPPADRAAYYRWLFFTAGPIEAAVFDRTTGRAVPPEKRGMSGYGDDFEEVVNALATALEGRVWIAANHFTAADLYVAAMLGWMLDFDMWPKREPFVGYAERAMSRPAHQRASALDDALLKSDE
jgi:glutathione S-transferase